MLSDSIVCRAIEIVANDPTIDILEAVKIAIQNENLLLAELIENRTERAKKLRNQMCKNVYAMTHVTEALK